MTAAVACSVKCRPHHRLSMPHSSSSPAAPRPSPTSRRPAPGPASLSFKAPPRGASCPAEAHRHETARRQAGAREAGPAAPMSATAVLAGAQSRHAIFREELVRRAYYTAEAAHRGHSSQPAATGSGLL
ncbi:hypothetical protein ZWY2020_059046 [Hordeum vulgare]|nr:hypothetical protein ZWY2020_059046 [Hordeum vulgare]